ncbi:transcription termination factor Rho [Aeromicrobium tamlense]|uniref:Transcription termination factor Rho n=1 Tax=Aeromicrobium tamlense TaxID=375541 RepID=A0A8I0FWS5_9ACTN|nr:transcription termination factor Rho [Aeromicrobium tamlense]NYI38645.1 transcription termination factor Rho [Aeromicrobium tamlense]
MTESTTVDPTPAEGADKAPAKAPRKSGGALGGKVIAELQEIANGLGIEGAAKMRKGQLIDAIKTARGDAKPAEAPRASQDTLIDVPAETKTSRPARAKKAAAEPAADAAPQAEPAQAEPVEAQAEQAEKPAKADKPQGEKSDKGQNDRGQGEKAQGDKAQDKGDRRESGDREGRGQGRNRNQDQGRGQGQGAGNRDNQSRDQSRETQNRDQNRDNQGRDNRDQNRDSRDNRDDDGGRRRNRRGRNRGGSGGRLEDNPTFTEDDVLVPAAGILDIHDNYAFVRTTGYLPSENDVYVSMSLVRKLGLRRGDAITGQVRQPREGERKEKFNPMVKVDSVNGSDAEEAKRRVDFSKLTPLYPSERLRLEGQAGGMTGRVIDLVSPIGKGQRGLIVSPPKAGKTMVMQQVANAITENNPECHLMIVLVDERPEEVTDFQRTVKGEVIASTFDRPASDHTTVAELAIERAKRLVELGHDVVVLLDGITRLGRAYNLAAPASGRIMSGGVDSSALYPPKKFFGAARNIEDGGSLTILATALIETGSRMDEVIFEEFKGTGNWELRLRREFADKRIFPAIDVDASSTRREELLMARDELAIVWKLRRLLSGLEGQQGLELILGKLKKTQNNVEFLMEINKTMPGGSNDGQS